MAQKKVRTKVCDRDLKPTPAEETFTFTFQSVDYEIDLCDKHAHQFHREMSSWTRMAREVSSQDFFADGEQWRDLLEREAQHRKDAGVVGPPRGATLLHHGEDEDDTELEEPPAFAEWGLTDHAKERQLERGFTHEEVMLAVTAPKRVFLHQKPGYRRHVRDRVTAIVMPEHRAVLTVLFANRQDYLDHQKKEKQRVRAS